MEIAAQPPQPRERPPLVCSRPTAVADDVHDQDRGELSGSAIAAAFPLPNSGTFSPNCHLSIAWRARIEMADHALQQSADEHQLLERARQKDGEAIRQLVKQQNRRLYRIARSIVRDDSDAEDVLQEAYVRAFAGLDGFRGESRFGTWLARIVINEALGCVRRRRSMVDIGLMSNSPALSAQVIPFPNSGAQRDPETAMAQDQIRVLLERAIDKLPEGFREILVARLIEGMSVEETAELFGILPQTVKTRLFRARALLRMEMEKHIGPVLGDAFPFEGRRCERLTDSHLARLGLS
jgi:RNA polymerase sigma-70 factor (ECF subfamily)